MRHLDDSERQLDVTGLRCRPPAQEPLDATAVRLGYLSELLFEPDHDHE